ncbi:hypothetical protein ABMC89_07790 [Sulfitobacter sp. HNIBRBA3233]|uniref:hypothetical protein n=1 Tax=Sulfitobacter marinivivus TaxID=3158558 RepID=UPI0032DEF374
METAKDVSQRLLEITGTALLSGDFDRFMSCFHLPHCIETSDRKAVLETRDQMRAVFDRVVCDYRRKGVTDLVRVCDVAEFRGSDRIEATHTTHMMAGNYRVQDPFPAFCVIARVDGDWKLSASQYAVDNNTTVGRALHNTDIGVPSAPGA